jgi:hypothetical protein
MVASAASIHLKVRLNHPIVTETVLIIHKYLQERQDFYYKAIIYVNMIVSVKQALTMRSGAVHQLPSVRPQKRISALGRDDSS